MRRRPLFGFMGSLLALACAGPAVVIGANHAILPEASARPAPKETRRRLMVAGRYKAIRSKGDPSRRKRKSNRLRVSRRVRNRHRRQRKAA